MKKPDPKLARALFEIVGAVQAKKREELRDQISLLQAAIGDKTDIISDRRALVWKPGGKGYQTVAARPPKPPKLFLVEWRGQGSNLMTLEDAAKAVRRTPGTLQAYLTHHQGKHSFLVDDEIITVYRDYLQKEPGQL